MPEGTYVAVLCTVLIWLLGVTLWAGRIIERVATHSRDLQATEDRWLGAREEIRDEVRTIHERLDRLTEIVTGNSRHRGPNG